MLTLHTVFRGNVFHTIINFHFSYYVSFYIKNAIQQIGNLLLPFGFGKKLTNKKQYSNCLFFDFQVRKSTIFTSFIGISDKTFGGCPKDSTKVFIKKRYLVCVFGRVEMLKFQIC